MKRPKRRVKTHTFSALFIGFLQAEGAAERGCEAEVEETFSGKALNVVV